MAPEGSTRFKSRFSLLSLLPSRHPPLHTSHHLPPTRSVPRHLTVVSISTVSPVRSEYASTSTPITLTPLKKEKEKISPHRPPPLDLDRTRIMYPASSVDVVIDPGTAKTTPAPAAQVTPPPLPPKTKGKKETGQEERVKRKKVVHDPFEVAEVEPGHRYPSWQGGKVDIRPGQVIPRGFVPSMAGSDTHSRSRSRAGSRPSMEEEGDNYESVLHNVLLTPTYLGPSPTLIPTPSPSPSPSTSRSPSGPSSNPKRRTLIEKAAVTIYNAALRSRHSRWMPGKSILKNTEVNRSVQAMREREEQEMDRFRRAGISLGLGPPGTRTHTSYSTGVSPIREMSNANSRRSPGWLGEREWAVGSESHESYEGKRVRVVSGDHDPGWGEIRKRENKAEKGQKIWKYSIAIIILCLAALTIGLCTSLLTKSSSKSSSTSDSDSASSSAFNTTSTTATGSAASASPTSTSQTLTTCLNLFTSSAPTSPSSYPCTDCVPLLTSTTNDFSTPLVNGNSTGVGSALQFCALMDIYKKVESASSGLSSWAQNASPCGGWSGVSCDSRGRVTGLTLQYPNVPDSISDTLSNIYAMESLHLLGNSSIPTGSFPKSLLSLPNFTTLDLEYTALSGPFSSVSFSPAAKLTTLVLVDNANLGSTLPDLSGNAALLTLATTKQNLSSLSVDHLPPSLTYLDLSYNSLSGTIPTFDKLSSLVTLYLENNAFTSPPTALPGTIQSLSLTANTGLSGSMPSDVCSSSTLTSCDLRNTELKATSNATSSTSASASVATLTLLTTRTAVVNGTTATVVATTTTTKITTAAALASASASASCGVCLFD